MKTPVETAMITSAENLAPDVRQAGRADYRTKTHAAVQDAVTERALVQVSGSDDGQQRPDRADEDREDESAGQRRLQRRRVLDIAKPGAHRAVDAFGGQCALEKRLPMPLVEDENHADKRERIEGKGPRRAGGGVSEGGDGQCRPAPGRGRGRD